MTNFHEMDLSPVLLKALDRIGFKEPTPIQAQTIPLALAGNDVMGSAQTGTGKTLAFSIPTIAALLADPKASALILTPTRELAQQISTYIKQLIKDLPQFNIALLIGGEHIAKQFTQLKSKPRVIVGTPGRVIDHLERQTLRCNNITFLVLDETDRMFDMGFSIQIEKIISQIPKERQTLMFSATFPPKIEQLAAKYLNSPKRISVGSEVSPVLRLKQESLKVVDTEKYANLLIQIQEREGSIIVFVKTKINADRIATRLAKEQHDASAIHGDLRQQKRERVMNSFRSGRCRIMVATDVAARGLDVPHVQHVINYDLPEDPEDYVHRVGRTARAGAEGCAMSFISPQDEHKWNAIQRFMDPSLPPLAYKASPRRGSKGAPRKMYGRAEPRSGSGNDRKPSRFAGAKTSEPRAEFGDRKPSRFAGARTSEPRAEFGDRKPSRFAGARTSEPRAEFGDRKPSRFAGARTSEPRAEFGGDRKPSRFAGARTSESRSAFGGERKSGFFGADKKPGQRSSSAKPSFRTKKLPS
jgi:superfamily II DNA/RNA helicase